MPAPTPEVYKRWYDANSATQKARVHERRQALTQWLREYKATLSCDRCGETHPACLDFHHRDPAEKEVDIARVTKRGWGKQRILAEIAKCDVLCANCHRKEHFRLRSIDGDAPAL